MFFEWVAGPYGKCKIPSGEFKPPTPKASKTFPSAFQKYERFGECTQSKVSMLINLTKSLFLVDLLLVSTCFLTDSLCAPVLKCNLQTNRILNRIFI